MALPVSHIGFVNGLKPVVTKRIEPMALCKKSNLSNTITSEFRNYNASSATSPPPVRMKGRQTGKGFSWYGTNVTKQGTMAAIVAMFVLSLFTVLLSCNE